jgi:hypothetical protein
VSKVGVYSIDISPPLGIGFIGYHRPEGISNVDERIYATTFVFETEMEKSVIVSVDNIGMLIDDTTEIRKQIAAELKLPLENVTVLFTHTHSGPETGGLDPLVVSYRTMLTANLVQSAVHANKNMQPSSIGWGVTEGNIGVNRREITEDGRAVMGTNLSGAVDNRIGVLAIKHQITNHFVGLIVFCTAHPNVLKGNSTVLSADYPGRTRDILQRTLQCPVAIVQGAAGNVNAKYRGSTEALDKLAFLLSGSVLTVIPSIDFNPLTELKIGSSSIDMKLKKIPDASSINKMATLAETEWGVKTEKWRSTLLDKYNGNNATITLKLDNQLLKLNEGSFSGIPMEPFSETALEIKEVLADELMFFGGYTNGYLGYLPTREAYPFGGYEVELSPVVYGPITGLWMPPEPDTAEQVVSKVVELYKSV